MQERVSACSQIQERLSACGQIQERVSACGQMQGVYLRPDAGEGACLWADEVHWDGQERHAVTLQGHNA